MWGWRVFVGQALRSVFVVFLLLASVAGQSFAESASRRLLLPEASQAEWHAVGRLNIRGRGYCTATLIAPDRVLTAAHCVIDRRTGRKWQPDRLHFLAGFRKGAYADHGRAIATNPADGYIEFGRPVARDMAIVHLARPVAEHIKPIALAEADDVAASETVSTYSYGRDRSFIMSVESACRIISRRGTLLRTNCEATPGVSGAPLIIRTPNGPRLAGVITAVTGAREPLMRGNALAVAADAPSFDRLIGHEAAALR